MRVMADALRGTGIVDPAFDARLLLCAAAGIDHLDLVRDPEFELGDEAAERLEAFLARRLNREPISRILGTRGFWSLDLEVTPDVLDPRPDSETLIDAALEFFVDRQNEPLRIADLGAGSGALLCALLDVFPAATGVGVDISDAACAVARRNLGAQGFHGRFSVLRGGWATAGRGPFDLVVSNPPYIATADIEGLDPEVRNFDPILALDGGADGLAAYREIVALLPGMLAVDGLAVLEIGHDQAEAVPALARAEALRVAEVRRDFGGKPRAILLRPAG